MGSCQSAPREAELSTPVKESKDTVSQTKGPERAASIDNQPGNKNDNHSDEGSDGKTAELSVANTVSPNAQTATQDSKKRVLGYSSGGSSDWSDEANTSSHNHLKDWKKELTSDGELSAAVVRIETDYGRPIEEIYEGVHDGPTLGSGISGTVRKVKHRTTGVSYAVKCLDLGLIRDEKGLQALRNEIFIMCHLDHPNIVRLEEVYESANEIYLIQELCTGGDLFDRLDEQPDYHYTEARCASLVKQMLSSIRYLHSKSIIHRDLKLENFLFSSTDPDSQLKMIDFGLSKHFTYLGELQHECVGTPYTVSPEVIRAEYDEKIDIWALGVITYLLLSGETPFGGVDGEALQSVRDRILKGILVFEPEDIWQHVSDAGKNFVKRLLNPVASKRPTAREAQLDPWLQIYGKKDTNQGTKLSPNIVQALMEFRNYSDMRKVLCEVLSYTLLPEQISELRQEFQKIDGDGDGEISLNDFQQVLAEKAEDGSLGGLTEAQIDDLFNALRLRKSDSTIRWHEFIAAGLSQCNFDERNLKLAFDRLDYDRTGFITLEDMKDLLGNGASDNGEVLKMWQEGMDEYCCPLGRLTYDDFRIILKGQGRDKDQSSKRRRSSYQPINEGSPLQAVPEGSISPQVKHSTFVKFEESPDLGSLKMPTLVSSPMHEMKKIDETNISFPKDILDDVPPTYKRTRSGSLGHTPAPLPWSEELDTAGSESDPKRSTHEDRRNKVVDPEKVSESTKEAFRKHHEFRKSVLQASKDFEKKALARKMEIAENKDSQTKDESIAGLVMRRKSSLKKIISEADQTEVKQPKSDEPENIQTDNSKPQPDNQSTSKNRMADASRRSGRPRRKTTSDISGMLK
eukprot:scaffold1376_cov125-Cylindrotheca_fusiformis.AAC.16